MRGVFTSAKRPNPIGCKRGPRLRAAFLDDDTRYAVAGERVYPVLLTSFKSGVHYAEEMLDPEEYPPDWTRNFYWSLKFGGAAALADPPPATRQALRR